MTVLFFNDTATTEIYTLSLHDALPILGRLPAAPCRARERRRVRLFPRRLRPFLARPAAALARLHAARSPGNAAEDPRRSEEHTSELQSRQYLVCRLLLEKKTLPSPPSP